jgi:ABC-type dipeptide/oligopeptide/nickel transport system permease subunit
MSDPTIAAGEALVDPVGSRADGETPTSLWQDAWSDLRRRPTFLVPAFMVLLLIVISIVPGLFANHDPRDCDLSRSLDHSGLLGSDLQGCDIYSRAVYGARVSVSVGLFTTLLCTAIGATMGMLAAYYGGRIDALLSRIGDIFFAVPLLLGAFVILSVFPARNVASIVLTLALLSWPSMARIARSAVITVRDMDFVQAARALGASDARILRRHILPNAIAPIIVVTTINLGVFITAEATLSFLGIGLTDSISWGVMIEDGRSRFLNHAGPLLWPAGFLFITVLSFIVLGDAVRDALDPKLR